MYTYIKSNIKNNYITLEEELPSELYEIGETFQDFLDGKWVLLSNEQIQFLHENPSSNVEEVWNMRLHPLYVRTLDDAKSEMIHNIEDYDQSEDVNSFIINGQSMWLSVEERQQLSTQISVNETFGREVMTRWFNGIEFTFHISVWKQMLLALEIYAGDAINVTEMHKHNISLLNTIEEVDSYNFAEGYPEKLVFDESYNEYDSNENMEENEEEIEEDDIEENNNENMEENEEEIEEDNIEENNNENMEESEEDNIEENNNEIES